MWAVIQHRWIKDSDQNGENEVWRGGRVKEARGQAKHNLESHLGVMFEHEHYPDADVEIDEENYTATWTEWGVKIYSIRYEVREVEDNAGL